MKSRPLVFLAAVVACQQPGVQPRRTATADSADQVYRNMTTDIVRNGLRESTVQAESAWVYQVRQVADLKTVHVTFYDTNGTRISDITSLTGLYHMHDQSFDWRGNVVAVSSEGRVIKTPHLTYDKTLNRITSDSPFTLTSPKGNLAGSSFEADPGFKTVTVTHPNHGVLKKGFVIPGQQPAGR